MRKKAGIADENIILDPGVGFSKTYENNLEIINKLECMHVLGYPILLGTSRKSVIGLTLDLPADQRMEGTVATTVIGVMKGVAFCPCTRCKRKLPCPEDDRSHPRQITGRWEKDDGYNLYQDLEVFANHGVYPEENQTGSEVCDQCGSFSGCADGRPDRRTGIFGKLRRSQPYDPGFFCRNIPLS